MIEQFEAMGDPNVLRVLITIMYPELTDEEITAKVLEMMGGH